MEYVIVGVVLALGGIGVAVWAVRGWLAERAQSATAQEARRADSAEHALAIRNQDEALTAALRRAADLEQRATDAENQARRLAAMLKATGSIPPDADALTVSEMHTVSGPPEVEGIPPATMQAALEKIAARAFSDGPERNRPLSRPGLVVAGELSRLQYDRLRDALVASGYFTPGEGKTSPTLTPAGRAMLQAIHEGRYIIR